MSKKLNPITGLPYVETINPITGLPFVTPPKNRDYVGRLTGVSVGTGSNSEFESYGIDPLAFYNKEEVRAQRQSLAEKWGNGAAKAGITLVGAIGENTVGTALGIGDWVFSGFDSFSESMANNPIGLLADEANKWAQEELPNYYTQEELAQKGTLGELGSANFWADKFLNGAAYSVGSIASMYLTGGTGLLGTTARVTGLSAKMSRGLAAYNVSKAVKAGKTVRQALPAAKATAARVGTGAARLEAGFTMSMAEAAVEARETKNSVKETLLEEAKKRKAALTGEMNWENVSLDDRELDQIELQAGEAEGAAFYANMAVLAPTNSIMFNKMIAPFRTSTNFNRVVRDATKDVRTYVEFAKTLPQGIRQAAIAGRVALPFVKNAVAEGFQEGMQYAISQGVSDYELRKFKSSGAGELVESLMESGRLSAMFDASGDILNKAKASFEDPEARSQMLVGAMVGLVTGGLGAVRENIQRSKNTKTVLDALNDAAFYRLGAKAENINAGVETIRRMIAAEEAGDMVTYNILQNELITTQVLTHIKLGSMDLFEQQMEDAKAMSDEQFKEEFGIDPEVKFTDTFNKTTIVDRILNSSKAIEKGKDIVDNIFQSSATAGAARLFMSKEDKLAEEERLQDEAIYKNALIHTYANLEYIDDAINNGLSALGEIAPSSGLAMNYAGGNRNRSAAQRFKRKTFGEVVVDEEGKETIIVPTDERFDKIIENITKAGENLNPLAKAEYDKKASEVLEFIGKRNTAALALDNLLRSPQERDLFVSRTKAKIEAEKIKLNDAKIDEIINSTTGVKDLVEKSKSVQGLAISPTALQKLRDEHLKRKAEKAKAINRFKAMRKSEVEALTELTPIEEEARTQHLKTRENEDPEVSSSDVAQTALDQLAGTGNNANNSPSPSSSPTPTTPTSDDSNITMLTRSKGIGEFILNSAGKVLVDDNGTPINSRIDSERTLNGVPIINGRNILQLETVTVGTVVELEAIEDDYWKKAKSDLENIGKEIEKMPVYIKIDGLYVGVLTAGNNIGRVAAVEEYLNAKAEGRPASPVTTVITKKLANNQMNTVVVSNTAESRPWFSNPYEVFGNVPVGVVRYNTDSPNLRVLQVENMHGYENEVEQIQTIAQRTNLDNLAFGQVVFFFKNPNGEWVASVGHTSNLDSEDINTAVNLLTVLGDPNKGRDAYDDLLKLVGLNTLPVEKRGQGPGVLYVSDNFVNEDRLIEFTAPGAYQGDQHTVVSIQSKYLKQLVDAYKQGRNIGDELVKIFKADKTLYGNLLKENYVDGEGKYQERGVGYNVFKNTKGEDVKFVNSIADHLINTILPNKKRQVEIVELRNDPNYFRNISRQIVKGADVLGHKGVIATDVQKNGNNFVVDIGLELSKDAVEVGGQKPAVRVTPIVPSQPAQPAQPVSGPPVGPPVGPPMGPPPGARVIDSLADLLGGSQPTPTAPEPGATNLEDLLPEQPVNTEETDTADPGDLADAPFRLGERSSQTLSETEAKKWLQDRGIPVEFYDSAIQVGTKVAHGYMKNALVYLWRNGQVGTEYHEAFHFVFRTLLNDTQREQLYKEAKKRYNLSKATNLELEEAMAEEFRDYVFTAQETGKGLTGKIKKFFQDIWNYIKAIFVNPVGVEQLFSMIESNKIPKKYERTFTPFKNETAAYSLVTTNLTKDPKAYKAVLASLSHHFINEMQKAEDEDLNLQETEETTEGLTDVEATQPTTIVKEGVPELFESNPELANSVYEALRFDKQDLSDAFINNLKLSGYNKYRKLTTYNLDNEAQKQNVQLGKPIAGRPIASKLFSNIQDAFKYVLNSSLPNRLDESSLLELRKDYLKKPLDEEDKQLGLNAIDYLIEVLPQITPQQKQEAQRLYSQYLESLNKPNTNPILQGNQQEQVKKFAELQERLNNKEFLEGAKSAYESTPALQQLGTQEEYNDYIARVSLGIIKNPSSGEYNYTSKVKDIVYHGSPKMSKSNAAKLLSKQKFTEDEYNSFLNSKFDTFDFSKSGSQSNSGIKGAAFFTTNPKVASFSDNYIYQAILNITDNIQRVDYQNELIDLGHLKKLVDDSIDFDRKGLIIENVIDSFENDKNKLGTTIAVFKPEQIHILGGKQDIEGFRAFVKQDVTEAKQPSKKTPKELRKARINRATELLGTKENDKGALAEYFYSLAFSTNAGEAISKEQLATIVSFGKDWEAIKDYLDGNGLKVGSPNKGSNIPAGLGGLSESHRLGNARILYEIYHNWFDVVDERLGNVDTAGWRSGVIDDLKKYGYDLKQKVRTIEVNIEMPEEEGVEVNEDEVLHEKIYNITHFEQSPAYRVSLDVRRMFGKMVKPTPNFLGMHTFIDIDTAYKAAVHATVGLKTFEEMKYAIEEAAKNHPELEAVANYLNTSITPAEAAKLRVVLGLDYTNHKFFEESYDDETGTTVRLIGSDRKTGATSYMSLWRTEAVQIVTDRPAALFKSEDGKLTINNNVLEGKTRLEHIQNAVKEYYNASELDLETKGKHLSDILWFMSMSFANNRNVNTSRVTSYLTNNPKDVRAFEANVVNLLKEAFNVTMSAGIVTKVELKNSPVNFFNNESSTVKNIAQRAAKFTLPTAMAFVSGRGKTIYPYNTGSHYSYIMNDLKRGKNSEIYQLFSLDESISNPEVKSIIFNLIENGEVDLDSFSLDTLKDEQENNNSEYKELKERESMIVRLGAFLSGDGMFANYAIPTQETRGRMDFVKLPVFDNPKSMKSFGLQSKSRKRLIGGIIMRDLIRINSDPTLKNSKINNGFHLSGMEDAVLSDGLSLSETVMDALNIGGEEYNEFVEKIAEMAENYLETTHKKQVEEFTARFNELGIENAEGKSRLDTEARAKFQSTEAMIDSYVFNSRIAKIETSMLLRGSAVISKDLTDFYKRMGLVNTPGDRLMIQGEISSDPEYGFLKEVTQAVISDVPLTDNAHDKIADNYEKFLSPRIGEEKAKQIADAYRKNSTADRTDGAAFISPTMFKAIRQGEGKWTPEDDIWYNEYLKGGEWKAKYTPNEKFYYENQVVIDGVVRTEMDKNSYVVLTREFVEGNTFLQDMYDRMMGIGAYVGMGEVHLINTVSAKKGYKGDVLNVKESMDSPVRFTDLKTLVQPGNKFLRPQRIDDKGKATTKLNRQVRKNMLAAVKDDGKYSFNGKSISGKQLKDIFHNSLGEVMESRINSTLEEIGYTQMVESPNNPEARINFLKNLREIIIENAELNGGVDNNTMEQLKIVEGDIIDFSLPLAFPAFQNKYQSLILSLFKNNVLNIEVPGKELVMVPSPGKFKIPGESKARELRFTDIDPKTGTIKAAEVMVSADMLKKLGLKVGEVGLAYRIPHQFYSSTVAIKVVGVLPDSYSKTIVVPGNFVVQTGADFDIDKLFVVFKTTEETATSEATNNMIEALKSIALSPEHFSDTITPLTQDTLNELAAREELFTPALFEFDHPLTELRIESNYKSAAKLVGIYANGLAGLSVAVHAKGNGVEDNNGLDIHPSKSVIFTKNGEEFVLNKIQTYLKTDPTQLTAYGLNESLSAGLDAGKKLIHLSLNDNEHTANARIFLRSIGMDDESIVYFLNQPLVKKFVFEKDRRGKTYSTFQLLKKDFGVNSQVIRAIRDNKETSTINVNFDTLRTVINENDSTSPEAKQLFIGFVKALYAGDQLSTIYKVITPDTVDGLNDLSLLEEYLDNLDAIKRNNANSLVSFEQVNNLLNGEDYALTKHFYNAIRKSLEVNSEVFLGGTPAVKQFKSILKTAIGKTKFSAVEHRFIDRMLFYHALTKSGSPLGAFLQKSDVKNLLTDPNNNLYTKVKDLMGRIPTLQTNTFLGKIREGRRFEDPLNRVFTIEIDNTDKMTTQMKDEMQLGFYQLMFTPEMYTTDAALQTEIKKLGKALVTNALVTTGLSPTYGSYFSSIPVQVFLTPITSKYVSEQISIGEYFRREFSEIKNNPEYFNDFLFDFIRNFGAISIKGSPLLGSIEKKSFTSANNGQSFVPNNPKIASSPQTMFKSFTDYGRSVDKTRIYQWDGTQYVELQQLGINGNIIELNLRDGDTISRDTIWNAGSPKPVTFVNKKGKAKVTNISARQGLTKAPDTALQNMLTLISDSRNDNSQSISC